MDDKPTIVCFRVFKKGGDVLAIFPEHEGARDGLCGSYQHIGQHADCCPLGLIAEGTRPATSEEYEPLRRELEARGYRLRIVKRIAHSNYWWHRRLQ